MFDKVVKSTVPGQVIEQIKELLVKGELKRGDRLPPERQLADMLGVSRPSLREALRALEYAGMLETRVGEGIFVADGDSIMMNNLLMLHLIKQYALEEMIEVRKVLETSNVRFAVLRARDEDLAALKEILEQSRGQIANKAAFIKSDYAFHQAHRRGVREQHPCHHAPDHADNDERLQLAAPHVAGRPPAGLRTPQKNRRGHP